MYSVNGLHVQLEEAVGALVADLGRVRWLARGSKMSWSEVVFHFFGKATAGSMMM